MVFGDVVVRVSPAFRIELHLDSDEATRRRALRNRGDVDGDQISPALRAGPAPHGGSLGTSRIALREGA